MVRAGLCVLLHQAPGLSVVAESAALRHGVELSQQLRPDVLLMASNPDRESCADMLDTLRRSVPEVCLVCLAEEGEGGPRELLCVPPNTGVVEFCSTLGSRLPPRCETCLLGPQCAARRIAVALSPRERDVAVRVASGMSTKQIAAVLGVRPRTVSTYRESLARKLGGSSAAVITRYVLQHGLE